MAETQLSTLKEPEIHREDILIVVDKYFKRANVAIVTGAASGVGRATAIAMGANGLTVLGVDVDEKRGAETVEMGKVLGGKIVFQKADLSRDQDIQAIVKEAQKLGTVKFLANIAGIQHINAVEDFPMEMYDRMMAIMLRAPFYLSKLCIPQMKKSEDGAGVIGFVSMYCTEPRQGEIGWALGTPYRGQAYAAEAAQRGAQLLDHGHVLE